MTASRRFPVRLSLLAALSLPACVHRGPAGITTENAEECSNYGELRCMDNRVTRCDSPRFTLELWHGHDRWGWATAESCGAGFCREPCGSYALCSLEPDKNALCTRSPDTSSVCESPTSQVRCDNGYIVDRAACRACIDRADRGVDAACAGALGRDCKTDADCAAALTCQRHDETDDTDPSWVGSNGPAPVVVHLWCDTTPSAMQGS